MGTRGLAEALGPGGVEALVARVASLAPGQEAPLRAALEELQASGRPVEAQARALWAFLTRRVLRPEHDVAAQRAVLEPVCRVAASASAAAPGQGGSITVPLWFPDEQLVASTNLARFMTKFGGSGGSSSSRLWAQRRWCGDPCADLLLLHRVSCEEPDAFWRQALEELGVRMAVPPRAVLQEGDPQDPDSVRWLPGARLNIAAAALTCPRALPGRPALVWAAEGAPSVLHTMQLPELHARCCRVAGGIRAMGFAPGDALAIDMPMTADAVVIYLSIVLAGCAVVSIADSFSSEEISTRLRISAAKAVFTQDVIWRAGKRLPLYDKVAAAAGCPRAVVLPAVGDGSSSAAPLQLEDVAAWLNGERPPLASASASAAQQGGGVAADAQAGSSLCVALRPGDISWGDFLTQHCSAAAATSGSSGSGSGGTGFQPHVADAYETTNILFSSGTTGEPKAIPWSHVTPLRCALDGWAHQDVQPGDVVAWPTSLGWMMGPWLVYAALLNGATIAVYEGSPLGRDFGVFVSRAGVNVLGLVPSIVKAWRSTGCMAGLNWTALKCFSSTGESSSPDDYAWLMSRVRGYRPVIEYCGGTELGGGYVSCTLLQPLAPSAFSMPTLGSCWVLATADGAQLQPSETPTPLSAPASAALPPVSGEVMLVPPMLGSSQRLLNADHDKVYYKDMPRHSATGRLLRRHGDELAVMILQLPARSLGGDGRAAAAASAATTAVPYYVALGRCDDTMNLGGIKISSVELERAVERNVADVAEVAAVGVPTPGGGPERLHLFVVLKQLQPNQPSKKASTAAAPSTTAAAAGGNSSLSGGHSPSAVSATADTVGTDTADVASSVAALKKACQAAISRHLSPLFKVDAVVVAPSLPRTASNKVMRRLLRGMAMRGGSLVASSVMAASAAQQTAAATTTRSKL